MLWGKKCRSYRGSNLGSFWAITPERLGAQRASLHALRCSRGAYAGGKILMKCRIAAAWERGKVYGFLLGFHTVNFVLSSQTAAKRECKFCVKIWFRNLQGLLRN